MRAANRKSFAKPPVPTFRKSILTRKAFADISTSKFSDQNEFKVPGQPTPSKFKLPQQPSSSLLRKRKLGEVKVAEEENLREANHLDMF